MVIWLVAAGGVLVVCNVCRCMEAQGFLDALQLRRTSADDNSERRILGTRTSPATRHGLAATWLWCSVQMYNAHGKPHSFSRALPSRSGTNARFQCSTPSTQEVWVPNPLQLGVCTSLRYGTPPMFGQKLSAYKKSPGTMCSQAGRALLTSVETVVKNMAQGREVLIEMGLIYFSQT